MATANNTDPVQTAASSQPVKNKFDDDDFVNKELERKMLIAEALNKFNEEEWK